MSSTVSERYFRFLEITKRETAFDIRISVSSQRQLLLSSLAHLQLPQSFLSPLCNVLFVFSCGFSRSPITSFWCTWSRMAALNYACKHRRISILVFLNLPSHLSPSPRLSRHFFAFFLYLSQDKCGFEFLGFAVSRTISYSLLVKRQATFSLENSGAIGYAIALFKQFAPKHLIRSLFHQALIPPFGALFLSPIFPPDRLLPFYLV